MYSAWPMAGSRWSSRRKSESPTDFTWHISFDRWRGVTWLNHSRIFSIRWIQSNDSGDHYCRLERINSPDAATHRPGRPCCDEDLVHVRLHPTGLGFRTNGSDCHRRGCRAILDSAKQGPIAARPRNLRRDAHRIGIRGQAWMSRNGLKCHGRRSWTKVVRFPMKQWHGPIFGDFNLTEDEQAAAVVLAMGLPLTFIPYETASRERILLECGNHDH